MKPRIKRIKKRAMAKAEEIVSLTVGLCSMEADWTGITPEFRQNMVDTTYRELLAGPRSSRDAKP